MTRPTTHDHRSPPTPRSWFNSFPDCQYAAGRAKTKTQLLREKIQDLESKIRALETASAARHSEGNSPAGDSSSSSPHNGSSADPDDLIGSPGSEFRTILGAARKLILPCPMSLTLSVVFFGTSFAWLRAEHGRVSQRSILNSDC